MYRFPSQTQDEFEKFLENLERDWDDLVQNKPFLAVVIGDFNAKSNNWCCREKSSLEGDTVDSITKQYGLLQVIREPAHILGNTLSFIHLPFTSQPNLITESGVHPSLHPNCHHQIVNAKINLQIYFPSPYLPEVSNWKDANTEWNWSRTQNHLVHKRTLRPIWLNGWVFVYELSGCGFESSCSHLNFRFRACFEQGVPWHSDNYIVWIHSETRMWHDKNIQLRQYWSYELPNLTCKESF